jgi:hypothetical protein
VPLEPTVLEFAAGERDTIVDIMDNLMSRHAGWINLEPAVDPDDIPARGTFRLFSVQGPAVPLCTWKPPDDKPRGVKFVSLGIQHGAGMKAVAYLERNGVFVPPRWKVLSDAPKRGVVIAVSPDEPHDTVLEWLLSAGRALCHLPYTQWRASVYRPGLPR